MSEKIAELVQQLSGELSNKAYEASDSLAHIGTDEVVDEMINLLNHTQAESRYLAARTLGLIEDNNAALTPLLEAIKNKENTDQAGDLFAALEGFDISDIYVEVFKFYLFGSFKVSMMAKSLLDYKEFNITPRVLRKAQKHWDHYSNNIKKDEIYDLRKIEVEEMLNDLREYIEG